MHAVILSWTTRHWYSSTHGDNISFSWGMVSWPDSPNGSSILSNNAWAWTPASGCSVRVARYACPERGKICFVALTCIFDQNKCSVITALNVSETVRPIPDWYDILVWHAPRAHSASCNKWGSWDQWDAHPAFHPTLPLSQQTCKWKHLVFLLLRWGLCASL